jgi:hypothetical protein
MCDGAFMQRPSTEQHIQVAKMVKTQGMPIWVDYDDDLFSVPSDNPTYSMYGKPSVQKNIAELIAMADIVTVSTEDLKNKFQKKEAPLNKNVVVIPNAFNNRMIKDLPKHPTQDLVLWRGSATHARDLVTHMPAMVEAFHKYERFTWCFIGPKKDQLWFMADEFKCKSGKDRAIFIDGQDPLEYFKFIRNAAAKVQIVPLKDNTFNRSKSNIAWIEGSYAGSACLVPDWQEWQQPGAFKYKDPDHFGVCLNEMLKSADHLSEPAHQSWEHIRHWLCLDEVNKKREAVLAQLSSITK